MPTFEQRLAEARRERGITQGQLAEAMNVSRQTVSHWENGRVKPDDETMKRLSEYLNLNELPDSAREEAAAGENSKAGKPVLHLLAAFICGALATALVVYGLLPLLTKNAESVPVQAAQEDDVIRPADYPFEWYQQPAENEAGKAYLKLLPDASPVKLMPSVIPDTEYMWNITFFIEETNGVPFTVTKFTETYFNAEHGVADAFTRTGAECTRFWQTALFEQGRNYGYNVYRPMDGCVGYGAAIEGIDANGNELAFGLYIPLSQEMERIYTPDEFMRDNPREQGRAYIEITPDNDPLPLVESTGFAGVRGWEYLFTISNTGDAPFMLKRIVQVTFSGERVLDKRVFTAEQIGCDTLLKGGEPIMLNGEAGYQSLTGIGTVAEGTDADGGELAFVNYVEFARE